MASRLGLRTLRATTLALVLSGIVFHAGPRAGLATSPDLVTVELSRHPALRGAVVSEISVSAPDTVRADEGESVYILATAGSGSPHSIITIAINGVPPNLTFSTNTPTAISPIATLSGVLGFETSGIWHLKWFASDQLGARDTATTELIVRGSPVNILPARVFTLGSDEVIRLPSGKPNWCAQVEPFAGYPLSDVILSSMELSYGLATIPAVVDKTVIDADRDGNGVIEITACFAKADLRSLFAGLPPGRSRVNVGVRGTFVNAAEFRGTLWVEVVGTRLASSISPNPLNPDATLEFSTTIAGRVTVSMFDLQGRLVRELWSDSFLPAGDHRVRIDGRGHQGEPLSSGVYLYRIATPEGIGSGRIVVLK